MNRRNPARRRTITGAARAARAAALVAATAVISLGLGAAPAIAATPDDGWLRVGHLSPDTAAVDVRIAPASGDQTALELDDVAYGVVSSYAALPAGDYELTMVPAGSPADSAPAVSADVTVTAGQASTVAAYGLNAELQTTAFVDDLTGPAAGDARIRIIQASTTVPSVDVTTTTGAAIATDAASGTATAYASVPYGDWDLVVTTPDAASYDASVSVAPGTVNTLFVLDNASGGLTVLPVLDSSAAGDAPDGSIETGGGALRDAGGAGAMGQGAAEKETAPTNATVTDAATPDPFTLIARFFTGLVQSARSALSS